MPPPELFLPPRFPVFPPTPCLTCPCSSQPVPSLPLSCHLTTPASPAFVASAIPAPTGSHQKTNPLRKSRLLFLTLQTPLLLQHIHANSSGQALGDDSRCHLQKPCRLLHARASPCLLLPPAPPPGCLSLQLPDADLCTAVSAWLGQSFACTPGSETEYPHHEQGGL